MVSDPCKFGMDDISNPNPEVVKIILRLIRNYINVDDSLHFEKHIHSKLRNMGLEVVLGIIACLCCTLGGAACIQMRPGGCRHVRVPAPNSGQAAVDDAIMEQLQKQDRQERLDAHIKRRARQVAEAVLSGKTPAEAAATSVNQTPAAIPSPVPVAMPRPMYYGPIMPQVGVAYPHIGYGYGYQTPLQQQIQRNNPFNGILI